VNQGGGTDLEKGVLRLLAHDQALVTESPFARAPWRGWRDRAFPTPSRPLQFQPFDV